MRIRIRNGEAGQTLVFVAVAFIVLLMFVGLAIEVGHVYLERRNMQNSADAGALAGAHMVCIDQKDLALSTAKTYAEQRNNPAAPSVHADPSFVGDYTVNVVVTEQTPLIFGGLLGSSGDRARRGGGCRQLRRSSEPCGLIPIAFADYQWQQMLDKCPAAPLSFCGTTTRIQESQRPRLNGLTSRMVTNVTHCRNYAITEPDCDLCNCTTTDGVLLTNQGRGWVDFTSADVNPGLFPGSCSKNGCGAAELSCWIKGKSPGQIPHFPICISGDSGDKWGTKKAIEARAAAAPPGNLALIPIFDTIDQCTPEGTGVCKHLFNITKVGCIKVMGTSKNVPALTWRATQTPAPGSTAMPPNSPCLPTNQNDHSVCFDAGKKAILVSAQCDGCDTACGGSRPAAATRET